MLQSIPTPFLPHFLSSMPRNLLPPQPLHEDTPNPELSLQWQPKSEPPGQRRSDPSWGCGAVTQTRGGQIKSFLRSQASDSSGYPGIGMNPPGKGRQRGRGGGGGGAGGELPWPRIPL